MSKIEQCLSEWSTGKHVKARFDERTSAVIYKGHFERLVEWHDLNPIVVGKILKTMYDRCRFVYLYFVPTMAQVSFRRSVGVADDVPISSMTDTMKDAVRKELENRTGETESESDGEM
jgi:hypothetical protein